jgi:uncharacterized protein (DUF983 family)
MNDNPGGREVNFLAAVKGKCPVCGKGRLFSGFLKVSDDCQNCGQNFKAADTGDGPVVFIILIAGFICCFGFVITDFAYQPPIWVHMVIWLPLALILSFGLMRPLKGVTVAFQLKNRVKDRSHGG